MTPRLIWRKGTWWCLIWIILFFVHFQIMFTIWIYLKGQSTDDSISWYTSSGTYFWRTSNIERNSSCHLNKSYIIITDTDEFCVLGLSNKSILILFKIIHAIFQFLLQLNVWNRVSHSNCAKNFNLSGLIEPLWLIYLVIAKEIQFVKI